MVGITAPVAMVCIANALRRAGSAASEGVGEDEDWPSRDTPPIRIVFSAWTADIVEAGRGSEKDGGIEDSGADQKGSEKFFAP